MRVLLVCMPFASLDIPSLGLGTLKARLRDRGISCDARYFSLVFADMLGRSSYQTLSEGLPHWSLVGEWVFTKCLYGPSADPGLRYVDEILRRELRSRRAVVDVALSARSAAPALIDAALGAVAWADYDVVGFTSSNAQNVASLALARELKERHPSLLIVFGGANWQGSMGVEAHKHFPFVDFACDGEADDSFPQLLRCVEKQDRAALSSVPGIVWRDGERTVTTGTAPPFGDLDTLPLPDHSDFFSALDDAPRASGALPMLSVESSRGCWWAQTRCCRFCGLNASGRVYRTKSPKRILSELRELARRWNVSRLCLADNVVSPAFLKHVLPALVDNPLPAPLFVDVRPDITRDEVRLLGRLQAHIQPGIESLNDHALELMGKGADALENVRLLKWCRLYGVVPFWNVLHGFPGETDDDYDATLELLPSLRFLRPPESCRRVRLDRFSPFSEASGRFGFRNVEALPVYAHLYPFSRTSLDRIAGSFAYECSTPPADPSRPADLETEVEEWRAEYSHASLRLVADSDGELRLRDDRPGADGAVVRLDPLEQVLYRACDDIGERSYLQELVEDCSPPGVTPPPRWTSAWLRWSDVA